MRSADSLTKLATQVEPVVIIGAGPAGLSAAYELSRAGVRSIVLEASGAFGGLSQTVEYKGYLFDIGGHRFFSKSAEINQIWSEVLGSDFLVRPRLSRIFYRNKFFKYPLEPLDALRQLGVFESMLCAASFLRAQIFPVRPENDFGTWVSNRFGRRLFEMFFKSYTEKVWGIPCSEIGSEWGAQRIKDLSLWSAVTHALLPKRSGGRVIKTLIDQFHYPRRGPGMMWTRMKELIEQAGCEVVTHAPVDQIQWEPGRVLGVRAGGRYYPGRQFISSMPMRDMIRALRPIASPQLEQAASGLHYRDFLTVALVVNAESLFPDNWIYIHDNSVKVGRIQNYKNWSVEMTPDPKMTCVGMEYFCFEGDELWRMDDPDLIQLASRELTAIGLAHPGQIVDGAVVRMPKAYPVYDGAYRAAVASIRQFLGMLPNFQVIGRNGMHRYNNQDHSMLTGIFAARNVLGGSYDLWRVNADAEYHESGPSHSSVMQPADADRLTPQRVGNGELRSESCSVSRNYSEP
ncbi:MAG TPA: NAD(P)/FAD-dependent oxidoreductase [Bryobacteraceae bacterium]|nr:NAD(P)/FAD-dependent oxidoreductase [Bryobacteraceae bacterium]